jgi:hypothetical protein
LDAYEKYGLEPEDFRVVLPIANIRVASFFDHTAYPKFVVESEAPEADSAAS